MKTIVILTRQSICFSIPICSCKTLISLLCDFKHLPFFADETFVLSFSEGGMTHLFPSTAEKYICLAGRWSLGLFGRWENGSSREMIHLPFLGAQDTVTIHHRFSISHKYKHICVNQDHCVQQAICLVRSSTCTLPYVSVAVICDKRFFKIIKLIKLPYFHMQFLTSLLKDNVFFHTANWW